MEQELKESFPHVRAPAGALVSTVSLLQPVFFQELGVPDQKRAGTPGLQEAAGRDKRNLDKTVLHQWLVHHPWEQKVGTSPSMPLYEGEQGSTIESCSLTNEQHVLLLPQPTSVE